MKALINALQFTEGPVNLTHCNHSKKTFMWLAASVTKGSLPPFAAPCTKVGCWEANQTLQRSLPAHSRHLPLVRPQLDPHLISRSETRTAHTSRWPDIKALRYSFPEAAIQHVVQHFCWPDGRTADEADSKIIRSNCRPSEWVGRAQSRRSKTRSSHPLWASILTCTICIRRTIGTSPLASFRFRYVRNAGK